jgi:hypothetical protein
MSATVLLSPGERRPEPAARLRIIDRERDDDRDAGFSDFLRGDRRLRATPSGAKSGAGSFRQPLG